MANSAVGLPGRRRSFRLLGQIVSLVAGTLVAALGAAAFLMSGYIIFMMKDEPKLLLLLPIFAFLGAVMLLLFLLGVKIIRETVHSLRDRPRENVDLEKEPWMADPQWRNRQVVYTIAEPFALRYLWIVSAVLLLWIIILGALIIPTRTLVIALSFCGGMALVLGLLYRSLEKRKVTIRPRDLLAAVIAVPLIPLSPFLLRGLIHPGSETGTLLLTTAVTSMVFGYGGILAYLYFRKRKFGVSICHLKTLPAYVGDAFKAEIEIEFPRIKSGLPELPIGPFDVELQNLWPKASGRGVDVQWKTRQTVPIHDVIRPGDGTLRIPVELAIPIEEREKMKGLRWRLEVLGPFPGVDYGAYFQVPVYYPQSEPVALSKA